MPYRILSPITHRRLGFRGGVLLVLGLLEVILGWSVLEAPLSHLQVFSAAPAALYAALWLLPGGTAMVTAFFSGTVEAVGYAASFVPFFLWGLGVGASWWPMHQLEAGQALRGACVYWAFALLIRLVARWPEPGERRL